MFFYVRTSVRGQEGVSAGIKGTSTCAHALVAHFIALASSKYALESESGKRDVF